MRVVKYFAITLLFLLVATVVALMLLLGNEKVLNQSLQTVIAQTGIPLRYTKLEGDILSGFSLKGVNYDDKIKADIALEVDYPPLKEGVVHIQKLHAENIWIDHDFLTSLIDANSSDKSEKKQKNDMIKKILVDDLSLTLHDTRYHEYEVKSLQLHVSDFAYDMDKKIDGKIQLALKSNLGALSSDIVVKDSRYDGDILLDPSSKYLQRFVKDQNITIDNSPHIAAKVEGDLSRADFDVKLLNTKLHYTTLAISPQLLHLTGSYDITQNGLDADARLLGTSDAADYNLSLQSSMDLDDLNGTLHYALKGDLTGAKPALAAFLKEQNLSFMKPSLIVLDANGTLKNVQANLKLKECEIKYGEYLVSLEHLTLKADYDLAKSGLKASGDGDIFSNAADLNLTFQTALNLNRPLKTLNLNLQSDLLPKKPFVAKLLAEQNVTLQNVPQLHIAAVTKGERVTANVQIDPLALKAKDIELETRKLNSRLHFNTATQKVDSALTADILSNVGTLKLDGNASAMLSDINNTLRYVAALKIRQKQPLFDLNLTQLGNISLDLNGTQKSVDALLHSKKLKAIVKSSDMNRFDFSLLSQKLYLNKLYLTLPEKLHKSYAALDAKGYYTLHEPQADVAVQLKTLHLAGRNIKTNRFRFKMKGKDFTLTPLEIRAKGFVMKLDAKSQNGAVSAHLKNRAVNATVAFKQKPLFADAKVNISSIRKLLHEVDKVYPLASIPKVDGAVSLTAKSANDGRIKISLLSPKITFEEGRVEKINLLAYYQKERVDIPTFDFQLRGFKPKKMNRAVHLAHPAFVVMKDDTMKIDFVLQNFLSFKAEKKDDLFSGTFKTKKLYLGMKGYGETRLTTDIQFYKSGEQTAVSGDVILSDTEITYESRVLDVSQDPDIIIIKKSKKRAAADNSFVKNTFLDLHIKSLDEIEYKVEAGTIVLKPDIEVRKDFGSKVKLLGKINILEGEYDLGDKRFQIKEGAIAFRGLEEINPHLDLHVEYPIDEVVIFIDILGDKRKPKLQFKSKPMMSKKDIFSYLLFGFAVSESDGAQSSAASAAEKIFGRALAKDLARELKLDRLDLTRNTLGGIDVKAGKKVNKKTIIYYQNKSMESSVIVEHKLGKHLELDVEAGQESQAADLFYKKGFK